MNEEVNMTIAEKMGITYYEGEDGLLYPNLAPTNNDGLPDEVGMFGGARKRYLREHRSGLYQKMKIEGTLWEHVCNTDSEADQMWDRLIRQMMKSEGVTEEVKRQDHLHWAALVTNIRERAREIVYHELIYV